MYVEFYQNSSITDLIFQIASGTVHSLQTYLINRHIFPVYLRSAIPMYLHEFLSMRLSSNRWIWCGINIPPLQAVVCSHTREMKACISLRVNTVAKYGMRKKSRQKVAFT